MPQTQPGTNCHRASHCQGNIQRYLGISQDISLGIRNSPGTVALDNRFQTPINGYTQRRRPAAAQPRCVYRYIQSIRPYESTNICHCVSLGSNRVVVQYFSPYRTTGKYAHGYSLGSALCQRVFAARAFGTNSGSCFSISTNFVALYQGTAQHRNLGVNLGSAYRYVRTNGNAVAYCQAIAHA